MADNTGTPMSLGVIFILIILAGTLVGGLLGLLRTELGAPIWLVGGSSGAIAAAIAQMLFRRRARAAQRDR